MADNGPIPTSAPRKAPINEFGEVVDLVKAYVEQETLGPLKGMGRKIGLGLAGAFGLGLGLFMLSLGLLRLIQTKIPRLAEGALSWIPYLIIFIFCASVTAYAVTRIEKIEKELT